MIRKGCLAFISILTSTTLALSSVQTFNDDILTNSAYWTSAQSIRFSDANISGDCKYLIDDETKSVYFSILLDDSPSDESNIMVTFTFHNGTKSDTLRIVPSQEEYEQYNYTIKAIMTFDENEGKTVFRIGITPPEKVIYSIDAVISVDFLSADICSYIPCDLSKIDEEDEEEKTAKSTTKPKTTKPRTTKADDDKTKRSYTTKAKRQDSDEKDDEETSEVVGTYKIDDIDESEESSKNTWAFAFIIVGCTAAVTAYAIINNKKQE